MIVEPLSFLLALSSVNPLFAKAFDFLTLVEQEGFPEGVFPLEGDSLKAIVESHMGKGKKAALLEAHKKYIDIQYVISGEDLIGWKPTELCGEIDQAYSGETDKMFFKDTPETWVKVRPGHFAIFFPHDAHAPLANKGNVKKVILKVKI
jgi:biofilm protein TabA